MSYSSSSLDEPLPRWTAYSPKKGVAWAPCSTHGLHDQEHHKKRFTLHGSFVSLLDSVTNLLSVSKNGKSGKLGLFGRPNSVSSLPGSSSEASLCPYTLQITRPRCSPELRQRQPPNWQSIPRHKAVKDTGVLCANEYNKEMTKKINANINNNCVSEYDCSVPNGRRAVTPCSPERPTSVPLSPKHGNCPQSGRYCPSHERKVNSLNRASGYNTDLQSQNQQCGQMSSDQHLFNPCLGNIEARQLPHKLQGMNGNYPVMGLQVKENFRRKNYHHRKKVISFEDEITSGENVGLEKCLKKSSELSQRFLINREDMCNSANVSSNGDQGSVHCPDQTSVPQPPVSRTGRPSRSPGNGYNKTDGAVTPARGLGLCRTLSVDSISQESTVSMEWDDSMDYLDGFDDIEFDLAGLDLAHLEYNHMQMRYIHETDNSDLHSEMRFVNSDESMEQEEVHVLPGNEKDFCVGNNNNYYYHKSVKSCDEEKGKLQHFLDEHDVSSVLLDRKVLRSGKLMMTGPNYSVCSGTMRTMNDTYPAYTRPIVIQIFKGLNDEIDRVNMLKNVMRVRALRHPYILEVLGLCVEGSPVTRDGVEVLLATERTHSHVTLHRLLRWARDNNSELLTARCAVTFALQICDGCRYLEHQRLLHSNLMTSTIRLNSACQIKLSGIEEHHVSTSRLNTRWLPLETLSDSHFSFKSVIWEYGVVLWEIVTLGQEPYPHLSNCEDVYIYLAKGKRLMRPDGCPKSLYQIMYECWHERPRDRPIFDHILSQLLKLRSTLPPSPPPEELFPDRDDFFEDEYI